MKVRLFVFDLDETLWSVTEGDLSAMDPPFRRVRPDGIADEGIGRIDLRPKVREVLEYLACQHCFLSLASTHSEEKAVEALRAFKIADYFVYPQFGWRQKDESIRRILASIQAEHQQSIPLEEVFFLDDYAGNVNVVRRLGVTALQFGKDVGSFAELLAVLEGRVD